MNTKSAPLTLLIFGAFALAGCSATGLDSPVGPSPFLSAQPGGATTASVKNQTPMFHVSACSTCGETSRGYRVDFRFQTWPFATYDLQVYERKGNEYVWIEEHDISRTFEPAGTYELYLPRGSYKFRLRATQQTSPGSAWIEGDWAEASTSF